MNRKSEKILLQRILKRINATKPYFLFKKWVLFCLWVLLVFLIVFLVSFFETGLLSVHMFMAISMLIGTLIGVATVMSSSAKKWPYLKPHINTVSIENRIKEIEKN